MALTITAHLWLRRLRSAVHRWFDFRVDLAGVALGDDDLIRDLGSGRE